VDVEPDRHKEANPASARVLIFEVTMRPGYELVTDARVDDRVYVGSRQWRRQLDNNSTRMKRA